MQCGPSPRADVGDEARLGNVMKLTGNFYIGAAIELIAEGMTMGERAGLSRETLLEYYSYMLPGGDARPQPTVLIAGL